MAGITRSAAVVWDGNLLQGSGSFTVGSGVMTDMAVSWPSRVEEPGGKTSPEELIAAAHASCYAMALSHTLTEGGHPPERLNVSAVITFAPLREGGFKVAKSALSVHGKVPSLDQAAFSDFAQKGEAGCPVSNALRGNVEITVEATLAP
jgi:osmotically inducible protein OsmC